MWTEYSGPKQFLITTIGDKMHGMGLMFLANFLHPQTKLNDHLVSNGTFVIIILFFTPLGFISIKSIH